MRVRLPSLTSGLGEGARSDGGVCKKTTVEGREEWGAGMHSPSGALLCPTSHWGVFLAAHWRVLPSKGTKVYLILSLKALFAPQRAQNDIQSFL